MKRLLIYTTAVLLAIPMAALAWAIPEARMAFAAVSIAIVVGLSRVAKRFPEMGRTHLRAAALLTLVGSIALAVLFPSTGHAPCPPPGGCPGVIDHHVALRLVIVTVGVVASFVLMARASRLPAEGAAEHATSKSR